MLCLPKVSSVAPCLVIHRSRALQLQLQGPPPSTPLPRQSDSASSPLDTFIALALVADSALLLPAKMIFRSLSNPNRVHFPRAL